MSKALTEGVDLVSEKFFSFYYFVVFASLICAVDIYLAMFCGSSVLKFERTIFVQNILGILLFVGSFYALIILILKIFFLNRLTANVVTEQFTERYMGTVSVSALITMAVKSENSLLYNEALRLKSEVQRIENGRAALVVIFVYLVLAFFMNETLTLGILTRDRNILQFFTIHLPAICCVIGFGWSGSKGFFCKKDFERESFKGAKS